MEEKKDKFDSWMLGDAEDWLENLSLRELLVVAERVENMMEYIDEKYHDVLGEMGDRTKREIDHLRTLQDRS